jgi:hypothetical protein
MANDARNTRDANPPRPNVVILNPPTAWRPLRGRMQTLQLESSSGTAVLLLYMAKKRSKNSRDGGI